MLMSGCQKGSQPCSFLSAFTALRHKSPRWRPFHAQVSTLVSCRWSFSNTSFLWVGLLALYQPLYPRGELFLPYSPLTTCMAGQWVYFIPNPQGRCEDGGREQRNVITPKWRSGLDMVMRGVKIPFAPLQTNWLCSWHLSITKERV